MSEIQSKQCRAMRKPPTTERTTDLCAEWHGEHRFSGDVDFHCRAGFTYLYVMTAVGLPYTKVGIAKDIDVRRDQLCGPLWLEVRFVKEFRSRSIATRFEAAVHRQLALLEHSREWYLACEEQVLHAVSRVTKRMGYEQ